MNTCTAIARGRLDVWVARAILIATAALTSGAMWLVLLALLPRGLRTLVLAATVAMVIAVVAGTGEGVTARVLKRARSLTNEEHQALAGALPRLDRLCARRPLGFDMARVQVLVERCPPGRVAYGVELVGRRTIVLTAALMKDLTTRSLAPDAAETLIAHALGRHAAAGPRLDVARRVLLAPWHLMLRVAASVGQRLRGLPLVGFAWRVRFVMATVAVVRGVARGEPGAGAAAGVTVVMTYLVPWAHRRWAAHLDAAGARLVGELDLAEVPPVLRLVPPVSERDALGWR